MTIHNKTPKETCGKTHNKPRASRTSAGLLSPILRMFGFRMLAILVLGSIALAFSCVPANPAVDGGNGGPTAPGAPTGLAVDEVNTDSTSFLLRWVAPTNTGTKADGTALTSAELGYRVYSLAVTAGEEKPSAESLRQNFAVETEEVTGGDTSTTIMRLKQNTRYFVTVASYNTLAPQLAETVSNEVVGVTTSEVKQNLEGSLSYGTKMTHEFVIGVGGSIMPASTPTIPSGGSTSASIVYSLDYRDGINFGTDLTIDSGIITISPSTNVGTATYTVQASADGYNTQQATLTIRIIENPNADGVGVSTYYNSEATYVIPVGLGQAVVDVGAFSMSDDTVILTLSDLMNGNHTIHFGTEADGGANIYNEMSYSITASNNIITIQKSVLLPVTNLGSSADGVVIGILGPGITEILHVATYYPSNIYGSHDLQAMRKDLTRDYVLKQNIVFVPLTDSTGTVTSNYEAVGDNSDPFTGSLDGASYTISGIQIEGTDTDNYQGLFGVMEAITVDTVIAQNLVLRDFKIKGNTYVGSLAGQVKRGTVDSVHVEVSNADAGKVGVSGLVEIGFMTYASFGGGLLGLAGTGSGDTQVSIQNTSSAVAVLGTGTSSSRIGGLVGEIEGNAELTESSATGSVLGDSEIGGLVGWNTGTVSGYATGTVTVTGTGNYVGGLVGWNTGTVTGYATGSVKGRGNQVGGLVGNNNAGTVIGYATGDVTGIVDVGGLMGWNDHTVTGYARGIVRRSGGSKVSFGKIIGLNSLNSVSVKVYSSADSSMSESQVYDGETGTIALTGTTGADGTAVTVDSTTTQSAFADFVFASELDAEGNPGPWIWVADGKWPAINIGDEVKPAAEQPIDPAAR